MEYTQSPAPGSVLLKYTGEELEIRLEGLPSHFQGFLRTNLRLADTIRLGIVKAVEDGLECSENWEDLPMTSEGDGRALLRIRLTEPGVFEFKAYAVNAAREMLWPDGFNVKVKVEPACLAGFNTIYNVFVRQFGANISGGASAMREECRRAAAFLDGHGYTVIPPSGTFQNVLDKLDFIMGTLGFRFLMFLPIHPTPTVFGKMGRYGSPFAPLDFRSVDPALAEFDRKYTPLEQFQKLADAIHARHGRVLIDLPLDHTGWASRLQNEHPEWFARNDDGTFANPGAWGVVWEDLCKFSFGERALWKEIADILLFWCAHGVDGFRCDAGYMIPLNVWRYLTAKVRLLYPDTVFLLEGLGGPWEQTHNLLLEGGMDWAYSESFQEFGFQSESSYLAKAIAAGGSLGALVNFAETHDNDRLAAKSSAWAYHRVASAALLSTAGAFAIANGVEWLATEKIDVHGAASLNWGASENLISLLSRLNGLLREHPAFYANAQLAVPENALGEVVALWRRNGEASCLVLVNPDFESPHEFSWTTELETLGEQPYDLLTGQRRSLQKEDARWKIVLAPGEVLCLDNAPRFPACANEYPFNLLVQVIRAQLLTIDSPCDWQDWVNGSLLQNASRWNIQPYELRRDAGRVFFLASSRKCVLLLHGDVPFECQLLVAGSSRKKVYGLPMAAGFGVLMAISPSEFVRGNSGFREAILQVRLFEHPNQEARMLSGHLCLEEHASSVNLCLQASDILPSHCALCTTDNGSYSMARAAWGVIQSKYDGLLHANLVPDYPDTQRAMLSHFRIWLRWRDYSQELGLNCQTGFWSSYGNALVWIFDIAILPGHSSFQLAVRWDLAEHSPAGQLSISCTYQPEDESDRIQLVVRPYVDVRNHHEVTKAYAGAEQEFPQAIAELEKGFSFTPWGQASLEMRSSQMSFVKCPEWHYGLPLPIEQERGLENSMDVFSPGCFIATCRPGDVVRLETAAAANLQQMHFPDFKLAEPRENGKVALGTDGERAAFLPSPLALDGEFRPLSLLDCLKAALRHFIVRRNEHSTIMAGYPWFLDWGRDTLICLRGLSAAGLHEVVQDTIAQFAKFERLGTLPNMLRGDDASDRDTSDAPLWLFAAVKTHVESLPGTSRQFLDMDCGGRTLAQVLIDLGTALWEGKSTNGVRCDQESGLMFSPPHFTWMDTNYPAGTPREGYPVEIQALWIMALRFLATLGKKSIWQSRADLAADSLTRMFVRTDGRGLSDCLHCHGFAPAASATPDDAVRPNQLFAITLQAVADKELCKDILRACEPLLIPGGIRSLDDADVNYPMPIYDQGRLLNDPGHPYWPKYSGVEDVTRKPAYHNGTAWGWQAPSFFEAAWMVYGKDALPQIKPWLYSVQKSLMDGCVGFLPEIYDGSYPHTQKGCPAQAWSISEYYRVLKLLDTVD